VAAGSYQWTRLKDVCLTQCQMPFAFLMRHGGFRRDVPSCLLLGLRHGAYCVGCCWALMVLLFVGGVMNLLWIVLLSLLIFLEKVTFLGRQIAPLAGIVLIAVGAWLLLAHKEKETTMSWTTPTLVEICIGLEINGYLPAEF